MKTLTLRNPGGNEPSSYEILLAAVQSPGQQGVTYDEIARRMPIITKLKAAKDAGSLTLEDAEFSALHDLFKRCAYAGVSATIVAVGDDFKAALEPEPAGKGSRKAA